MVYSLTNAEVENKVAFLVQLNAVLTQINAVVSSSTLSSAQKTKLGDVKAATEAWLKDVGKVGAPRPSITSASQLPHSPVGERATPTAAAPAETSTPTAAAAAAAAAGEGGEAEAAPPASSAPASAPSSPEPAKLAPSPAREAAAAPGSSSSFTADMSSTHVVAEGRSVVDLVGYLRLLFDSDVPERAKLQAFGKSLVRLLMVRCCSTIMASLQHVVHHSYAASPAAAAQPTRESPTVAEGGGGEGGALGEEEESPPSPTPSSPSAAAEAQGGDKMALFVELAREINVATKALLGSVQLVAASAVPTDAASARFPVQLCVDVVKQTRRALLYFQSRVEREELHVLRSRALAAADTMEPSARLEDVDAAQDALQRAPAEDLAAHVRSRTEAMQQLWGPSLARSIRHIGDVIDPAVRLLVSVAGVRAEGAPAPLVALKRDAAHDIFSLCGIATATTPPANATKTAAAASSGLARPPSAGELTSLPTLNGTTAATAASPASAVAGAASPAMRAAAAEVLSRLGSSYTADYVAAVARCSGDSNEGQLLATRLLADMLDYVAQHEVPLLRSVVQHRRWSRPLYEGILNCVVSIQPGVLAAGLDALRLLTTACPAQLGQEVGFLYSNVVLRLLESSNSPHYVKRTIVLHFLTTLLSGASAVPSASDGGRGVPLILHLYRLYDLNVHAHQLNFVQQFTSALSRIVRAAPKEDFIQDAVVQEQLRRQQQQPGHTPHERDGGGAAAAAAAAGASASANGGDGRGGGGGGGAAAAAADGPSFDNASHATLTASLAALSLPAMALHGLVRIVELLTTQAPPDDESGRDVLAALPAVPNREWKLKEQQQVDLFNASPKKAVYKMFGVTPEENAIPAEYSDFASQWDHTRLPPVPSAETAQKVEAVADFLTSIGSLDPEAVVEFLTTPAVFPLHVCTAYLRRLPLAGQSVLEAIGELLMRVQLPKEGQRIERLLEYFSAAYFDANSAPGVDADVFPFKNDTAVFIVVVATVMLNTNIHNPLSGMRLDLKAFRGQLKRCNDDESFADAFVDEIFFSISTRPLESIKTIAIDTSAGADAASRGTFDMFFVSLEEKRQLAFGVERQRMVSETRQLLQLRTAQPELPAASAEWWCAATRDFFLSTWSAVCAVFGPAMYEGSSAPLPVLLQCVRGLQALLCTAAAFDLQTECTVTLLTLLRMADSTPVRTHCRRAVLGVAATSYAVHFPVRCWVAVCQLMLELRLSTTAAAPPLVEDVFTRIESLTRLSVEADERRAAAAETTPGAAAAGAVVADCRPTAALHRVLAGVMTTISGYAVGDVDNLSAALVLLRRALEYTRIIHGKRATDVVYYVNIRDFTDVVVPAYVELIQKHSMSDDGLQVLFECLVEVLCTMWMSYTSRRVTVPKCELESEQMAPSSGEAVRFDVGESRGRSEGPPAYITVDTAPTGFVRCFRCLRSIYDVTLRSPDDGAATLLQMHVLQAVKEVLTRTVRAAEVTSEGQHLSLYTMVAAWQQALYPLGMALCDRRTTTSEAGSLALLVLRKLVALSGGTGGTSTDRLPPQVRGAMLWLLAQLCYTGGMCGDVDGAQVCVALLSSICTTTLAMSHTLATPAAWSGTGSSSPVGAVSAAEAASVAEREPLTQQVVAAIEGGPEYVVRRTLARLGLLLRCEREQTRAEVVHQLRTLALQMRPAQVVALATDLAEVVLEGAIGHAAHHYKTAITHTSLIPFLFLEMPVPASMRRCSRTSFRATLPAALGFLASELLSGLSGDALVTAGELIMRRCLLPILLCPSSPYQARFLAVRALSQCTAVCLPQSSDGPQPRLAQCVLDCLSLALFAVQLPLAAAVPPAASFVGRRWLDAPATAALAAEWAAYSAAARGVGRLMDTAEPEWIVRGTGAATAAPLAGEGAETGAAPPTRSGRSGAEEARRAALLLPDEPLIEYVNLLAQVLAGVPRELAGVVARARLCAATDAATPVGEGEGNGASWSLPRTSAPVLLQLSLQAAGTLFGILWRINHPYEVEQHALQSVEPGREAPALTRNGGLLPHAAIRSVLQCYLELAVLCDDYPTSQVLAVTTDVIEAVRQVQLAAQPASTTATASPTPAPQAASAAGAPASLLAADAASLQRLSPQEQQHVRTCNSGMYQQLAAVLGHLVRLLTGQPLSAARELAVGQSWAARRTAFEAMARHPHFFSSLVSLLTPTAGMLIVTVRDYFAWYIAHTEAMATAPAPASPHGVASTAQHSSSSSSGSHEHTNEPAAHGAAPTSTPGEAAVVGERDELLEGEVAVTDNVVASGCSVQGKEEEEEEEEEEDSLL